MNFEFRASYFFAILTVSSTLEPSSVQGLAHSREILVSASGRRNEDKATPAFRAVIIPTAWTKASLCAESSLSEQSLPRTPSCLKSVCVLCEDMKRGHPQV